MITNKATLPNTPLQLENRNWTRLAWSDLGLYAWASVLTGANPPEIVSAFGLGTAVGVSMAGLLPWMLAHASERNPGHAGSVAGFVQTGVGTEMLLGPAVIGVLAQAASLTLAMDTTIVLMLSLGLLFSAPAEKPPGQAHQHPSQCGTCVGEAKRIFWKHD